jgi:hypothetical protein
MICRIKLNSIKSFIVYNKASAIFIVIYIVAIVIFGQIYFALGPRNFYDPYIKLERPAEDDANKVISVVKSSINDRISRYNKEMTTTFGNRIGRVDIDDVKNLDVSGHDAYFRIKISQKVGPVIVRCTYDISILADRTFQSLDVDTYAKTGDRNIIYVLPVDISTPKYYFFANSKLCNILLNGILKTQVEIPTNDESESTLSLPENILPSIQLTPIDNAALSNYIQGMNGDPSLISAARIRYTYFSATTITTTGYGDIIPITKRARALAATEAVLGWIIAGLFLSSLAAGIRGKRH